MGLETGKKRGARRGLTFKVLVVVPFCIALAIQGVMCVAVLAGSETLEQMETTCFPSAYRAGQAILRTT